MYGVEDQPLGFIKSYFVDKKQRVNFNEKNIVFEKCIIRRTSGLHIRPCTVFIYITKLVMRMIQIRRTTKYFSAETLLIVISDAKKIF